MTPDIHEVDRLAAYVEGQLDGSARMEVAAHLTLCASCRTVLDEVKRGIAFAEELEAEPMPEAVAATVRLRLMRPHRSPWVGVAAAAVVALGGLATYWQVNRPWADMQSAIAAPTAFEQEGRELHRRLVSGERPDYAPTSDADAWRWLASQQAPVTSLRPNHPPEDRARFVPVGAAVRQVGGARASVISYRVDDRPVTLVLAHQSHVADAPSAGWWSKRVTHRRDASGANSLTWTVGGGTYVMVSELDGYGQRACFVCHTDRRFQEPVSRLAP